MISAFYDSSELLDLEGTMPWTEITRPDYDRRGQRYASDVTDAEWRLIEPFMPRKAKTGRPLAPSRGHVLDRVLNRAHICPARTPHFRGRWHERLNKRPFTISAIACITLTRSVMVRASDFCPKHDFLQVLQPKRITTC